MKRSIAVKEAIETKIHLIRGHRVMLDSDLAELYGVRTMVLNQAVKRNLERFPSDFMFQLTWQESENLKSQFATSNLVSQFVISKERRGGSRFKPYAFTEQGVAMLSSVLHSKRAIQANIAIMRTFVRLKELASAHKELAHKLDAIERKLEGHDADIHSLFEAIRGLMAPPKERPKSIGFVKP